MEGISAAEGFAEVSEGVAEMIRYLANEPSLGLFFVQQHARDAVPNLVSAKDKVVDKSREVTYVTEDLEDSLNMVKSMNDCGFLIADGMNKEIKRALHTMSTSHPKRGLISGKTSSFSKSRGSPWSPDSLNESPSSTPQHSNSSNYFSTVLNSAKQKASALKWSPVDITSQFANSRANMFVSPSFLSGPVEAEKKSLTGDTILEEYPASSELTDKESDKESSSTEMSLIPAENYERFKCEQEARLEKWLGDSQVVEDDAQ